MTLDSTFVFSERVWAIQQSDQVHTVAGNSAYHPLIYINGP